jgi:hypothetical protein
MDLGLILTILAVGVGLVGLSLLSVEWLGPLLESRRQRSLFAAEDLIKRLMLRGSPDAQQAVKDGIVPFAKPLETYEIAAVIATIEGAKLRLAERRELAFAAARARPFAKRRLQRALPADGELVKEVIGLLRDVEMTKLVPAPRRFGYAILGTALTAVAIFLAIPGYLVGAQQAAADRAAIDRLVGEVLQADSSARLGGMLKASPSDVDIVFVPILGEGYARQLRGIFGASGWRVTIEQSIFSSADPHAVAVVLNLANRPDARTVTNALDAVGVSYVPQFDVGATKVQELDLTLPEGR